MGLGYRSFGAFLARVPTGLSLRMWFFAPTLLSFISNGVETAGPCPTLRSSRDDKLGAGFQWAVASGV